MRFTLVLTGSLLACLLSLTSARAQGVFASNAAFASKPNVAGSTGPASTGAASVVLTGKITSLQGPLPGAVVFLTGTSEMAVTNADGEFEFTVPANAGPLQARVTYAGYADENITLNASAAESTVNLANARVIVVSRCNQMKKYLKTAHRQVKRDLKKMRKS